MLNSPSSDLIFVCKYSEKRFVCKFFAVFFDTQCHFSLSFLFSPPCALTKQDKCHFASTRHLSSAHSHPLPRPLTHCAPVLPIEARRGSTRSSIYFNSKQRLIRLEAYSTSTRSTPPEAWPGRAATAYWPWGTIVLPSPSARCACRCTNICGQQTWFHPGWSLPLTLHCDSRSQGCYMRMTILFLYKITGYCFGLLTEKTYLCSKNNKPLTV